MTSPIRRRDFLKTLGASAATLGLAGSGLLNAAPRTGKRQPNIVFIMVDDLGKEWISAYGATDIETPHIDRLAREGLRFDSAYSMAQCTPSRVTLLTGQYPYHTGWVNHWDVPRWGVAYFDWKKHTTVANLLHDAGYKTAAAGKWQINDFRVAPDALEKLGFDDWAMWTGGETGVRASHKRYDNPYINTPGEGSKTYEGKFGPDIFNDFLIDFVKRHRDEPMFLYYPMCLTHTPLVRTPDEPNAGTKLERHKAMVRYTDKLVGKLVKAIENEGLARDTIVIFTTDNGSTRGITGHRKGVAVKGAKAKKSEAGVCAPYIAWGPGRVPAGKTTDALTDFTDLVPTFCDLAGKPLPEGLALDGVSIAPVLLGRADASTRGWILAMGHGAAKLRAKGVRGRHTFASRVLRDRRYKVWVDTNRAIAELYDLEEDPWEKTNLIDSQAPEHVAIVEKYKKVVAAMPEQDAHPQYVPREPNPWDRTPPGQGKK
jgi:arylsulfatase A-like enzyme